MHAPVIMPSGQIAQQQCITVLFHSFLAHERTLSEAECEAVGMDAVFDQCATGSQAKARQPFPV